MLACITAYTFYTIRRLARFASHANISHTKYNTPQIKKSQQKFLLTLHGSLCLSIDYFGLQEYN